MDSFHSAYHCIILSLFLAEIISASRPFTIEPPDNLAATDESLTMDQVIRRVIESHDDKPWMKSQETMSMLMSGDSSMVLAEMDMMLTNEQYRRLYAGSPSFSNTDSQKMNSRSHSSTHPSAHPRAHSRQKRKIYRIAKPWKNNEVPYVLSPWDFSGNERAIMHLAMQEWEQYTCIKFRPSNSSDEDKLVFQNGLGCNSQLGQVGGPQSLNLEAPGCRFKGLYLHEIGHALGLVHEHQLPNRDSHIDIIWNNVKPEWKQWFNKYSPSEFSEDAGGVPYDFTSVMHYGINAFSFDDQAQTIKARDHSLEDSIGRVYKKELSFNDIKSVNSIYHCNARCQTNIVCTDGGYVDKNCMCTCPAGGNGCQTHPKVPPIPTSSCRNKHSSNSECDKWAGEDQCSLNPIWMIENCRHSCDKCDRVSELRIPTKSCKNSFDDKDCDTYAMAGECSANPAWMYHNCKASCGWCKMPSSCKDLYPDSLQCRQWKRLGHCDRNLAWMWANCRRTCGVCSNPPAGCTNKAGDDKCFADASVGECKENSEYMNENCAKACGKCGSCFNEFPEDSICIDLAKAGECALSPEWMERYCKKACEACDGNGLPIGEARPCADKDGRCSEWAKDGECTANPSWMIPNCQKSCKKCDCINKHGDTQCDKWAERGECESNTPWLSENCQKSCKFCTNLPPPPDRCSNKYQTNAAKCNQWESEGECFKNPLFMLPNCRKSCTKCGTANACDRWSLWSAWTGCSTTCGTGLRSRTRRCLGEEGGTQDEMLGCMMSGCLTTTAGTTTTMSPRSTTPMSTVTPSISTGSCKNKYQRDTDCETWAKFGHCESNPSWMHVNCAKSCKLCSSSVICKNKYGDDSHCEDWADDGQCTANPNWMLGNCAKACNQCDSIGVVTTSSPTKICRNLHTSEAQCKSWSKAGHCEFNPSYMHVNCAKTCGVCGGTTQTTTEKITLTTVSPSMTTSTSRGDRKTEPPPPPDCADTHESCADWADSPRSYCKTSVYVKEHCKTSCGLCTTPLQKESNGTDLYIKDVCYDRSSQCRRFASEGRCVSHSKHMRKTCPFSCEYCLPDICVNADSNCNRWAQARACHIFPKLMSKKCKLACGYCKNNGAAAGKVYQP